MAHNVQSVNQTVSVCSDNWLQSAIFTIVDKTSKVPVWQGWRGGGVVVNHERKGEGGRVTPAQIFSPFWEVLLCQLY